MNSPRGASLIEALLLCLLIAGASLASAVHLASSYRATHKIRVSVFKLSNAPIRSENCTFQAHHLFNEILSICQETGLPKDGYLRARRWP